MLKVLIADDEEMSRSVISHILSSNLKNHLILLEA